MASRGQTVFGAACALAAATIYFVHTNEEETRKRMKQGPKRDRERIEATTARLYQQALEEWDEKEQQGTQPPPPGSQQ